MEVDAANQDERAVKFDLYTCGRLRILISFLPNMRSQMREKARPIFAESGRSLSSTIRRYTYGRDYGPREPVSAVFSLCLFFVCLGGHDDRRQPAGYGWGAGDGNCSATFGSIQVGLFSQGIALERIATGFSCPYRCGGPAPRLTQRCGCAAPPN